jgi:hypothetical protein
MVVGVLMVMAPVMVRAQTGAIPPDDPQDLARIMLAVDALNHLKPEVAQMALRYASKSDISKMLWVVEAQRKIQHGAVPTLPPPRASYQPASPSVGYSAAPAYSSPPVITANPYLGTPLSQYDARVNQYSPNGAQNPYTTSGGKIYGSDGTYLGKLNANPYDPESVANPYGKYGSKYSPTSINNPYSAYGSKYSTQSARNPYATTPPRVIYGDTTRHR